MSKEAFETYIVVIGQRQGERYAERRPLNVPLDLAVGAYEELSDLQVREFLNDLLAEQMRREAIEAAASAIADKCGGYDPFASQIRRTS